MILLLAVSLVLSFLLSGLETAVLSVSRVRVRHAAEEKDRRAAKLLKLLDDRDGLLGALTIANHLANVVAFGLICLQLVKLFGDRGYVFGFIVALPIFIIGLEVLPKNLCRRYPFRSLIRFLPLIQIAGFFRGLFRPIRTLPAIAVDERDPMKSGREDFSRLLGEMSDQKLLPASAVDLIQRVLQSRPVTASTVMVPMERVISISAEASAELARSLAHQHQISSLVVSDPANGNMIGVIDTTTLPHKLPADRTVRHFTRPIDHVEATAPALSILQRLRRRGHHLALVTATRDNTTPLGLVTEDDIVASLLPRETAK